MRERGLDLSGHRARQLTRELLSTFELVRVMETAQQRAAVAFGAGGESFADVPALTAALRAALDRAGDDVRVLVKGSRFNRLERVVEALAGDALPGRGGH